MKGHAGEVAVDFVTVDADTAGALRKVYFALSGAAPHNKWLEPKSPEEGCWMGSSIRSPFRTG